MESSAKQIHKNLTSWLAVATFVILAVIVFGLLWLFVLSPSHPSDLGWYLFAFAAGLSMIVLPCTLPLAFVIVPLSMGRGVAKGLGIALAFSAGIAVTLSLYGVIAAILGGVAIDSLGAPLETVKNWVYFVAGIFALLFALSEIGLLKFRMPSYTGAAPSFIQKKGDFLKAFLLGLFLGNIGIGCPHPATPLILIEVASSGNVLYGWLLFLVHAVGRILPLLFLAFLGILGVSGLSWIVSKKEKVEKATGWAMVFVAGFILTLGLFSHKWWVNSGIHTQLEKLTQEEKLLNIVRENLQSPITHTHGLETGTGLFGLPLWLGNWFLVTIWVIPIWWWWFRKKKHEKKIPDTETVPKKLSEQSLVSTKKYLFLVLTLLLAITFIYVLPNNFLLESEIPHDNEDITSEETQNHMADSELNHLTQSYFYEEGDVKVGLAINFSHEPETIIADAPVSLKFFANRQPEELPVTDLKKEHGKFIHAVGVRDDLTQFFHIHPEQVAPGLWASDYAFSEPGVYKIWSDIERDGHYTFGHPLFAVLSRIESVSTQKSVVISKSFVVDDYHVSARYPEPIVKERNTAIEFIIHNAFDEEIEIEPYLEADMHLAVVSDDLSYFIHTHPDGRGDSSADESEHGHSFSIPSANAHGDEEKHVSFNLAFPKAGLYKLFAQFRPKGINLPEEQSLVAEFYVQVAEGGPAYLSIEETRVSASPPMEKTGMVMVSLILMALVGFGVNKFINVKS